MGFTVHRTQEYLIRAALKGSVIAMPSLSGVFIVLVVVTGTIQESDGNLSEQRNEILDILLRKPG